MTRLCRKGDRIRLLCPTIGGWQGEAVVAEDQYDEDDNLIYFRRADDPGNDPDRAPGCCIRSELELVDD